MKILIAGDVHKQFKIFQYVLNKEQPDICFQVGDLGLEKDTELTLPCPVYFIYGNHEDFDLLEKINMGVGSKIVPNLTYMRNGQMFLFPKYDLRVCGIGGNYAPMRFKYKHTDTQLLGGRRRHFNFEDCERAKTNAVQPLDFFLSHDNPNNGLFALYGHGGWSKGIGSPELLDVLDTVKPRYWFFGHHHSHYEFQRNETKIIGLPGIDRGYVIFNDNSIDCRFVEHVKYENSIEKEK